MKLSESSPLNSPAAMLRSGDPIASRIPFYYGWVMLPLAIVAQWCTSCGQTFGISVFNPSLQSALDLTATQLTGAYLVGSFCACFAVPFFGWMMDRYGIRRAMSLVVVLLGGACLAMSQVQGLASLTVAFLLLRMLGQGALSLLSSNSLAMWFQRRLGTVTGIMNASMAGAFGVLPPTFLYLIHELGWRSAYMSIGFTVWIVMLPLLLVLFRDRPEAVGQSIDGEPPARQLAATESGDEDPHAGVPKAVAAEADVSEPESLELSAALGTRSYWIVTAMQAVWAMVGTGLVFNLIPVFEDHDLTAKTAAKCFTVLALAMGGMQLVGGVLADRIRLHRLLAVSMGGVTLAGIALIQAYTVTAAYGFAALFGAAQGLFVVVSTTVWPRYYGLQHLGKIRGSVWMATVAGSSFGPFLMGSLMDLTGSYSYSLWIFVLMSGLLVPAALFATPPRQRRTPSDLHPQSG